MSWATAVVLIVLIAAAARVLRARYQSSGSARIGEKDNEEDSSARELELQQEVEQLRERIHVLERIATDGRQAKAIAEEIESLRDK
ncbi:hypothetical protein [Altererythrobacter sp. MF3-039]|uniref:hypothetical protein n=1 Tax=Altererythrobacter sp. MF3-039 TaxID=3252901 RepID=UPI00390C5828